MLISQLVGVALVALAVPMATTGCPIAHPEPLPDTAAIRVEIEGLVEDASMLASLQELIWKRIASVRGLVRQDPLVHPPSEEPLCPLDVKHCPDGTWVSRNPHMQCNFDQCPDCAMVVCPPGHFLVGTHASGCGGHCEQRHSDCAKLDCPPDQFLVGADAQGCGGNCERAEHHSDCAKLDCPPDHFLVGADAQGCGGHCERAEHHSGCAKLDCRPDHFLVGADAQGCGGHCEQHHCERRDCPPDQYAVDTDDRGCGGHCVVGTPEPAKPRPTSAAAMAEEAAGIRAYEGLFSQVMRNMVDYRRDKSLPACTAVSQAWFELCGDLSICTAGHPRADERPLPGHRGDGHSTLSNICCRNEGWDDVNQRPLLAPGSCDDADWGWRAAQSPDGDHGDCCDACAAASGLDHADPKYQSSCVAERFVGPSVCGVDSEGNVDVPEFLSECSTGPHHEFTGVGDADCEWDHDAQWDVCGGRTCGFTSSSLADLKAEYAAHEANADGSDFAWWERDAGKALAEMARAQIVNGAAGNHAGVTMNLRYDDTGEACAAAALEATTGGELEIVQGAVWVYKPNSLAGGNIRIGEMASMNLLGGSNHGTVGIAHAQGAIRVVDVENTGRIEIEEAGNVMIAGVHNEGNVYISGSRVSVLDVFNSGNVEFKGSGCDAYQIANSGTITFSHGSVGHLELTANSGTVTFEGGSSGSVSAPAGTAVHIHEGAAVEVNWF